MSLTTPTNDFAIVRPEVQNSRVLSPQQLTQFEVQSMQDEQRRLSYYSDKTNEELNQVQEQELFINLSLVKLFQNLSATIIAIINEILEVNQDTTFEDFILIFVKGNRLVYLGILLIMIALAIYIVDITRD
jgi:hypothetical protein